MNSFKKGLSLIGVLIVFTIAIFSLMNINVLELTKVNEELTGVVEFVELPEPNWQVTLNPNFVFSNEIE